MADGRFDGRVAIVTGAGRGIGRAIAERLAADGASVVVGDLDDAAADETVAAIEAAGGQALAVHVDVTRPDDVAALAAAATDRFGRIDILVNNAGILRSTMAAEVSPEEWHLVVDANLTGSFLCARAVYPALRESGHGRIVNMASMAGRATSTLGGVHYTTAKAGVLGLSRHLAREWARDGITVNAVSPGVVLGTEFFGDRMTDEVKLEAFRQPRIVRPLRPSGLWQWVEVEKRRSSDAKV